MNLKLTSFLLVALLALTLLAACSPKSSTVPSPTPTEDQDYVIGPVSSGLPIIPPLYTVPEPAGINPGKIIGSVYISSQDKNYHTAGCSNLGPDATSVLRQSAVIQGYSACSLCNP